jgi:hypothetical protein
MGTGVLQISPGGWGGGYFKNIKNVWYSEVQIGGQKQRSNISDQEPNLQQVILKV